MAIFVQPMQPPLEQPLRGRPTGPIYVTLVESTLFDGTRKKGRVELSYQITSKPAFFYFGLGYTLKVQCPSQQSQNMSLGPFTKAFDFLANGMKSQAPTHFVCSCMQSCLNSQLSTFMNLTL